jgi:hypothetical protein
MKHADIVAVGDRRNENVDWREAVVADPCQLLMSIERELFDVGVDRQVGERTQLSEELVVVACATRRVAGFKEERDTSRQLSRFEEVSDLVAAFWVERVVGKADPGGVVDEESRRHSARPARASHFVGGVAAHRRRSGTDPIGEAATKRFGIIAARAELVQLGVRAQHHEFRELEALRAKLLAKLVQRGLNGGRLRDGVAAALSRHEVSVAPVSHRERG